MRAKPSVFLVDDEDTALFILRSMAVKNDLRIGGEFQSAEAALEALSAFKADVIVLDEVFDNGGMNGSQATAAMRALAPGTKILSITAHREPARLSRIWESGVDALTEKYDAHEFSDALHAILNDRRYIHPECSQLVLKSTRS